MLQTIYVLNKEILQQNLRFIIKSGFKSRAGYDGAHMVDIKYEFELSQAKEIEQANSSRAYKFSKLKLS